MLDCDVLVVGAGPAGCAAAAAVAAGSPRARLLIVDRARFPRDKVCGDGIAAEVDDELDSLGFDTAAVFAGAPPIRVLSLTAPSGATVSRTMARAVHVLARARFDARLVDDLRRRGVDVEHRQVRALVAHRDAVVVDDAIRARVVIAADGAQSVIRRHLWPPQRPDRVALAMRGYAAEIPGQHGRQLITMTAQHWPAYAWSFPLGDGRANVGYGQLLSSGSTTRDHLLRRMDELLPGLDANPALLRAHRLPLSSGRPAIAAGRILLVGDAQSLINPLTGEGIYYAVASGALAGAAANRHLTDAALDPATTYRRLMRTRFGRHFRHTDVVTRLGGRPWLVDAAVSAASRRQEVFDDLVRIGLADGRVTARLLKSLRRAH